MESKVWSVFGDRHHAGEDLYFRWRHGEPDLFVALGPGGAEVAYPSAFLHGGELYQRTVHELAAGAAPPVRGATVVLADDGCAGVADLLAALHHLRAGGPARLLLMVPWLPPGFARLAGVARADVICVKARSLPPGQPLYDGPPCEESARWCLEGVEKVRRDDLCSFEPYEP